MVNFNFNFWIVIGIDYSKKEELELRKFGFELELTNILNLNWNWSWETLPPPHKGEQYINIEPKYPEGGYSQSVLRPHVVFNVPIYFLLIQWRLQRHLTWSANHENDPELWFLVCLFCCSRRIPTLSFIQHSLYVWVVEKPLPHHSHRRNTERWSRNTLRVVTAMVFYVFREVFNVPLYFW